MNYQNSNVEQTHHIQSTQQRQNPQKSQVGTPMNNAVQWGGNMKLQSSGSPKNMSRKTPLYPAQQIQYQQINLPAVNQSRSERSLENTSGGTGILQQTQRFQGGSQTSRDHPSSSHNLQNQQMVPSVYTNQGVGSLMGSGAQISIKQNQNEKIKAYSRKLAKLVSSNNVGQSSSSKNIMNPGPQSNSKTPNSKKKLKTSTLGITQNLGLAFNQDPVQKLLRSGLGTSRENIHPQNLNLQTQQLQYQYGMVGGGQVLQTARTNSNNAFPNQTFDIDEHIKNVIKSVERKNRKLGQSNMQGYSQGGNSTGMINVPQNIAVAGGSQTARNNGRSGSNGINEYSPTNTKNTYQQQIYQNQITANTATHKNTIFSNFSNQTYQMGQKKHSQQSHSLGKKGSHPGIIGGVISNSIMMTQAANNTRSSQRRRSSSKREGMPSKTSMSHRALQESELYGGAQTLRTLQNYEDAMIKKFKDPSSSQSSIPSHSAYNQTKRQSVKVSKGINQSLNQRQNQSTHLNQSAHKKSGWFSPTSTYQGNNNMSSQSNAFIQQIALSGIDNNSSSTGIDKTLRTSQFVSPRSFQNKSGAYNQQMLQAALGNLQQQQRQSMGVENVRNPILVQSMDMDDSEYENLQNLQSLRFSQNFPARKVFQHWKMQSGKESYLRKRDNLFENMLTAKSQTFSENHRLIKAQMSIIKNLKFYVEQSDKASLIQDQEKREVAKVQQFNESISNIKALLEKMSVSIVKSNNEYERRIKESRSTGRKSTDNKQFLQKIESDNMKVIHQRCNNYDRFLKFILVVLCSSLSEMLINNKNFKGGKIKQYVKFEHLGNSQVNSDQNQYMTNTYYFLSLIPDSTLLLESLKHGIDQCQQLIFNNRKLIECITKIISLFFYKPMKNDSFWDINLFYNKIEFILNASQGNIKKDQVLDYVSSDVQEAQQIVKSYENLKSILEFNEKWEGQQHNSRGFDINSNRETFQLMETYQRMIKDIPKYPIQLKCISLDFRQLYDQVHSIPNRVIKQIERVVAQSLETDTNALKIDLSKAYEILQQTPSSLNIYVEQINTVKVIKETMSEFNNRHDSIKKLSLLCKGDNRIKINDQTLEIIKKVEYYIENLPILIRQSQEKLDQARPQMENQMTSSCISLTNKIKMFEQKYVEHYIEDRSKMSDSSQTLNEIKYRQKMMDDLKSKVDLYRECIQIMNIKDMSSELTCFEDFKQMETLHSYTLKLWTILDEWRNQKQSILLKPFLVLNFADIATYVEDSMSFLEQKSNEDELFKDKLSGLASYIQKEMSDIQTIVYFLKDLKKDFIKKRHWQLIFLEMGYPNFKEDFTIQDLQKMGTYSQNEKIRDITLLAEKEYQYEQQIVFINQAISTYKFKLTLFKEDIYLLSDFDIVQSQLEEFQVQLKRLNKDQMNDVETVELLIETQSSIDNMLALIEKWLDAQKVIITLDQIFSQSYVSKTLGSDYKKFTDLKKLFRMQVSGRAQSATNIKAFFLHQQDISDTLDKIISKTTLIQKSIEDFLETKRLAFPRFFFMTDKQFLEFIELAEQNLDFNKYINILFPGAHKVFLDQPLIQQANISHKPKVPPTMVNDLSAVKSEFLDMSMGLNYNTNDIRNTLGKQLANQKEMTFKQINTIELNNSDIMESSFSEAFNSNKPQSNQIQQQILNKKPKEVLGLISSLNELFLFEKKVPYMANKVECWLQGTETNMQDTIGKLINYAVNTFPKQSLDEWILDYPQQIILTTIHLILTHEINELFEEMKKEKEGQGEGRNGTGDHRNRHHQNSDNGGDSDDDYTGATPKTPDTRDLVKNSQISHTHRTVSQQISQKSSVRYVKKDTNKKGFEGSLLPPVKSDTQGFNSKNIYNNLGAGNQTSSNYSSNQQKINMIKNQLQFKNQFYSDGTEDMGYIANASELGYPLGNLGENDCDDFSEAELEALDLSRERKKFASNMFGSDFELTQIADNKDDTMRILQEKSFRGLYLRLQFWINQICKSLYMSKASTFDWKTAFDKDLNNLAAPETPSLQLTLHPVQKLVMQTIINFLSYMRDVVHELKYKGIDNVDDFEWQKQMRLTWNGKDSGCKVDCGAWTTQQANEYLGSQQRIPLTPLTNKYFVFISAAFREKSAVLFRSIPSHDYCGDIYQEFSNICSVPFKEYNCNAKLSMKSLMQFLNGAALASVWIFFEHVDKLDYVHLQTFNKEIQMVQQQFIIAELSQDSSVITAHITVGNQSISQCQRSIERIREQASQESKKVEQEDGTMRHYGAPSKIHIQGGADIKIEDNNDYEGEAIEEEVKQFLQKDDKLNRQAKKSELQYKGKAHLQNLSQVELEEVEDDDIHFDQDMLEEQDDLKQDDANNNNNTLGGGNSKVNNKVCFGVFASISHIFNLQNDKWATELSVALQSAFRVLSLTKPEMPIITSMILKSFGFRLYKDLAYKINDVLTAVADMLHLSDKDDSFTITVRDIKRLVVACNAQLEQLIKLESKEQRDQFRQVNELMVYPMEKKSKAQILKEIEDEDFREKIQKEKRNKIEAKTVSIVLELFLLEKLQVCSLQKKIKEEKIKKEVRDILSGVFGKDLFKESEQKVVPKQDSVDSLIIKNADQKGCSINSNDLPKFKAIYECIKQSNPVAIVGRSNSGKTKAIKILAKQMLQKELVFINPSSIGTHREMYGIYDPFSTNQHVIQQQLGQVKYPLFKVLKNEISKPNSLLIIEGGSQYDESDQSLMIFNETMLPYLEKHKFKSNDDYNENNMLPYVQIKLPNGIVEQLKSGIPIIYELRTLQNLTPRFISALTIISMDEGVSMNQVANRLKRELYRFIETNGLNKKEKSSNIQQSVEFAVNQIIVPIIKELHKAKYLDKCFISISEAMLYCLGTVKCYVKHITSLGSSLDQALYEISLISVVQSIGYSLSPEGKSALEQICAQLKQQLHIRGTIFNYSYDTQSSKIIELKPVKIDNDFIINNELLRISSYARLLISCGKSLCIEGPAGTQKSTIMRYLLKNHQPEISSLVIKIPMTCYHQYKTLRTLVNQKQPQQQSKKPTLIVIDDLHIGQSFNIDILQFLQTVKQNNFTFFSPDSNHVINLNQNYAVLCASRTMNKQDSKFKMNKVSINNDNGNQEFQDFFKTFVQKKLQVQPQYALQLQNVILKLTKWLRDNKSKVNCSSNIELSNLHLFSNMINKINSSPFKDYSPIESFIIEVKSILTARMIYPDTRKLALDYLLTTLKDEISTQSLQYNTNDLDNMFFTLSSPNKAQVNPQQLKEEYGTHYSIPIAQQLNILSLSLQKKTPRNHFLFVTSPGSQIQEGILSISEKVKFNVIVPNNKKYTDGASFVDKINRSIEQSLRTQTKIIILIDDIEHNDLAYIDYILNLIQATNDASQYQQSSSSYFNALSSITSRNSPTLRDILLQLSKESNLQTANPASPSSLAVAPSSGQVSSNMNVQGPNISDAQILINELNKISSSITFIMTIQNLQNYHRYVTLYPQLETLFNVSFISSEKQSDESTQNVQAEISQWISEYSMGITYNSSYIQSLKSAQHSYNGQINEFFIGDNKDQDIFKNGNFENLSFYKIPSELNIGIPVQYSQSQQRLALFDQLYQQLKQVIFKSLSQQKSFYQKYYQHYLDLNQSFMNKLLGGKDLNSQLTKQHIHAFSLLQVQERIDSLHALIKSKDSAVKSKEKEKHDFQDLLEKIKQEITFSKQEADQKLQVILQKLKAVNQNEFKSLHQLMNQGQLNDYEIEIIQVLGQLLFSKSKTSQTYLLLPSQELLIKIQSSINSSSQQEQLLHKFYKKKASNEGLERSLVIIFNKLIIEWAKKQSVGRSQAQMSLKMKSVKEQISFNSSLIELYKKQVQDNKEELEDQLMKEKNMKQEMRDILKKIDMKELKQLRNEHKLKSLIKQGKKSEQKLDKIQIRMKNLDGDCLILACSILYLGPLSVQERNEYRKQLAEKLLSLKNIESSEYWQNTQSEQIHSKYFKKIIKNDLGLEHRLFTKQNHLFIDSLLSEFIFSLLFSPSTFIVYDSVGNFQQFLSEDILEEIKTFRVKMLFSSDYFIEEKITNAIEQQSNQIVFLNDVNDFSTQIQGKCQDSSILNRLAHPNNIHRIANLFSENQSLTLPSIILFSSNQLFNLNTGYLASSTIYNATFVNKNEAWIEIKQILLKHFLPDNYQKLIMIKQQIEILKEKLVFKQKAFDQLFIKVKCHSIEEKDHKQLEEIRTLYLDIKQLDEDFSQYNQAFHNLINEHPLLASYSNIFVILYYALKELTRYTEEITYSWKIYTKVIDMIIGKIIRDLTMNLKNKENGEESDGEEEAKGQKDSKKKPKKDKEFTIDEEFFHSVIMPSIYSTIISGVKQDHVSLFNLLFALEIALKKTTVTQDEKDFFVQRFFKIKNCGEWRLNPHKPTPIPTGFADPNARIKLTDFMNLKRDLLKTYPELRKLFETIEIKIGKEFTYREANTLVYQKLFKLNGDGQTWKDLPLIRKINVGFICPDDEWRSKICQFVYEELSTIFDFTEDLNKLHNFIKTASWSLPVALFTSNSINIVNTVCSIASYYGVGLEVLRTDYQQSIKKHEKYYSNKEINDNFKQVYGLPDPDKPLSNEAACTHFEEIDPSKDDRVLLEKSNVQKMFVKDELEIDDKQITQNQSSMQLIEKCAENGTWVLISTLKFPSFWYKISRKLEKLHKKGKVLNTFRLFFDLQGYSIQEIPESFLFNHCVKFYLTEKNNEDMEGFNDVWANILNDDLLNAKDLHNVPVLEPHSYLQQNNLNLESNMYESSLDSMLPVAVSNSQSKEQMNPNQNNNQKLVKDDRITYSMSQYQSKDTILLPQIFTHEHMLEIMAGGNDLTSPKNKIFGKHISKQIKHHQFMDDDLSDISKSNIDIKQEFLSQTQSLLMEDISRGEGAFLSELNHAFAKRMPENEQQKYEMIKQVGPHHKRAPPKQ